MRPAAHAVVLLAHGSRDREWARPLRRLQRLLRSRLAGAPVELAFLELAAPTFDEVLARILRRGAARVTVVPLFLGRGRHLGRDVASLLARAKRRHPGLALGALPALGDAPAVLEAIAAWIADSRLSS